MNSLGFDLIGIGNAIMDLQLGVSFEDFNQMNLTPGTMNLVEEEDIRSLLENVDSRTCVQSSGGSGANTCIALSDLGHGISYSCIVGEDDFGRQYIEDLKKTGVRLFNEPIGGRNTGRSLVLITPDAERTMNTYLGVTSSFGPEHLNPDAIAQSSWLYIEGYLFSTESGQAAVAEAVRIAKGAKTKIAMTFSDTFIVDCFRDSVLSCAKQAELIFANKTEACAFTKTDDVEKALSHLAELAPKVAVTMSEKGALVSYQGEVFTQDTFLVKAVDDTGAGDSFAAGFLSGELQGKDPRYSATTGCFLASKVVSQVGARLNQPLKEVLRSPEYLARLS